MKNGKRRLQQREEDLRDINKRKQRAAQIGCFHELPVNRHHELNTKLSFCQDELDCDVHSGVACFLSHVHSDHLKGLESFKSTFVYCTAQTRELLLRLEKYPHRMNFAKGILESRKQTYRRLKNHIKPIPLETPTEIELAPGQSIRVTLFDANHCLGSCMFLIEGNGKAILYTGDLRSETWWVNTLIRNPVLLPYTKDTRRLDNIYLDTTFTSSDTLEFEMPTKAEGLSELIEKVSQYPSDTVFYLNTWTFGYEEVWIALAAALRTRVHLDDYRWRLYSSQRDQPTCYGPQTAPLVGYKLGNHEHPGCLTNSLEGVRIHSCERGTRCEVFQNRRFISARYEHTDLTSPMQHAWYGLRLS